jgi:hypothetical protein
MWLIQSSYEIYEQFLHIPEGFSNIYQPVIYENFMHINNVTICDERFRDISRDKLIYSVTTDAILKCFAD